MSTHDFGSGPVAAHRHPNGGGWVAETAWVADTVWVAPEATVAEFARIWDEVRLLGRARVSGQACLMQHVVVSGDAAVRGSARAFGHARIGGHAIVEGRATLLGGVVLGGHALLFGFAVASGRAVMQEWSRVGGGAVLGGHVHVRGEALLAGMCQAREHAVLAGQVRAIGSCYIGGHAVLDGVVRMDGSPVICGHVVVFGSGDGVRITGRSRLQGAPRISGSPRFMDGCFVSGHPVIRDRVVLRDKARVTGAARLGDDVQVTGNGAVDGSAELRGDLVVDGATRLGDDLDDLLPPLDADEGPGPAAAAMERQEVTAGSADDERRRAEFDEMLEAADFGLPEEDGQDGDRGAAPPRDDAEHDEEWERYRQRRLCRVSSLETGGLRGDAVDGGLILSAVPPALRRPKEPERAAPARLEGPVPSEEAPTQAPWWLSGAAPTIDDILEPLEALAKEFEDISERPDAAGHEEPAPVELICVSRVSREHGRTGWATLAVGPTEDGGVRGGWNSGDARRRAELMSVIAGLEALEGAADIRVRCPSHYLLDGVTNWAREARTRNWRGKRGTRIAHDDLWRRLFALTDGRSIKWLSRPDSDSAGWTAVLAEAERQVAEAPREDRTW